MLCSLREERGVRIGFVAIVLTTLIGFGVVIVDVGNLYINKTRLIKMADAAVLAGVQDLPTNSQSAISNVYQYIDQNGQSNDVVEVSISNNNKMITVNLARKVPSFLDAFFSSTARDVTVQTAASISPIDGVKGVAPFGIVRQQFICGQTYTLKAGTVSGSRGDYAALALGGTGSNLYRSNLENGYDGQLCVGDWVGIEGGNMSTSTRQSMEYRIGLDQAATFTTVGQDSPRILILPVIEPSRGEDHNEVLIVGFAPFFLEGVGGQANNSYIIGKFMEMAVPGDGNSEDIGYGLYSFTLLK